LRLFIIVLMVASFQTHTALWREAQYHAGPISNSSNQKSTGTATWDSFV